MGYHGEKSKKEIDRDSTEDPLIEREDERGAEEEIEEEGKEAEAEAEEEEEEQEEQDEEKGEEEKTEKKHRDRVIVKGYLRPDGTSYYVIIPKEIRELFGLKGGEYFIIKPKTGKGKIELKLAKFIEE